jgi:hypothetical protein
MTGGDFILWLACAAFGTVLMALVLMRYVRPIFSERLASPAEKPGAASASGAWLYCEEGAPLDKRAGWFRVRPGGSTVLGNTPRTASADTAFIYLSAHDLHDRQVTIRWDPQRRRYVLQRGEGQVRHNNEPVPEGAVLPLTDGDSIELGELTRIRFTHTPPPMEKPA